jgi:hypothetical protein
MAARYAFRMYRTHRRPRKRILRRGCFAVWRRRLRAKTLSYREHTRQVHAAEWRPAEPAGSLSQGETGARSES